MSTSNKEMKMVAAGDPAMEKLFEAFEDNELLEDFDLKSLEIALKKVELDIKNIRRVLKAYRKTNKPAPEVLKG
jgi:hypothetical protein